MDSVTKRLGLQPDILDGATILKAYGDEYAVIENYKSLIEYEENLVKLQGKHVKVMILGEHLYIESFDQEECRVCGRIREIHFVRM